MKRCATPRRLHPSPALVSRLCFSAQLPHYLSAKKRCFFLIINQYQQQLNFSELNRSSMFSLWMDVKRERTVQCNTSFICVATPVSFVRPSSVVVLDRIREMRPRFGDQTPWMTRRIGRPRLVFLSSTELTSTPYVALVGRWSVSSVVKRT